MKEYDARLKVTLSKKGKKIFTAEFVNDKGKTQSMVVQASVCAFDQDKVETGESARVEISDSGQVSCCKVPGKEAVPMRKNRQPQNNASFTQSTGAAPRKLPPLDNATAPYNFIPYDPDAVLPPFNGDKPRWSGSLRCRLTARTPLLVAGKRAKTAQDEASDCEFLKIGGKPVIPGSSIKGMLRSLVEILSYSQMRPVYDKPLFWRLVSRPEYRERFPQDEILGGYLYRVGARYRLKKVRITRIPRDARAKTDQEKVTTGGFIKNGKKSTAYAFELPNAASESIPVDNEIVDTFRRQMTPSQKGRWKEDRLARKGMPVFYRTEGGKVAELGMCRYFRLCYRYSPAELAKVTEEEDFTSALFGSVRPRAKRGKIAVSAAFVTGKPTKPYKVVLGEPKPTCLPLYLCQMAKLRRLQFGKQPNDPESLENYDSVDAKLRGRKCYWHHKVDEDYFPEVPSAKVASILHPFSEGASAEFTIYLDRLTDLELGALLAAVELPDGHAHKLGMGKSLGFGSVRVEIIESRVWDVWQKYSSLARRLGEEAITPLELPARNSLREEFYARVFNELKKLDKTAKAQNYEQLPQIAALRMMMDFYHQPTPQEVKTMKLKQFALNAVLPEPKKVIGSSNV